MRRSRSLLRYWAVSVMYGTMPLMTGRRSMDDRRFVFRFRRADGFVPAAPRWPMTVPAVAALMRDGLELAPGLTVLVGENGSGKSTLVELMAEAYGLNPQGGSKGTSTGLHDSEPHLGGALRADRGLRKPPWAYFLRADTMHGLYTFLAQNPGTAGSDGMLHHMSHGEGFLEMLRNRVDAAGFYLMDEPDAPLSFTSQLALVALLGDHIRAGSQIVVATHSPLIAATPGATILELGPWGMRPVEWEALDLVQSWQTFLSDPDIYLRYLDE